LLFINTPQEIVYITGRAVWFNHS